MSAHHTVVSTSVQRGRGKRPSEGEWDGRTLRTMKANRRKVGQRRVSPEGLAPFGRRQTAGMSGRQLPATQEDGNAELSCLDFRHVNSFRGVIQGAGDTDVLPVEGFCFLLIIELERLGGGHQHVFPVHK